MTANDIPDLRQPSIGDKADRLHADKSLDGLGQNGSKPLADTGFRRQAVQMASNPEANLRYPVLAVVAGIAFGTLIALPALLAAIMSAGAGHGDYGAARMLFPVPMLLTLIEGSIGPLSLSVALIQFPLYGALLGWSISRTSYKGAFLAASLHLAAAVVCFMGILPSFS